MELSEFVKILVCPETRQTLRLLDAAPLEALNAKIADGSVKNRGGERVTEVLDAGFVREDGQWVYPVRGNLPLMLIDEAIRGV